MAEQSDIHIMQLSLGTIASASAGTLVLGRVPPGFGGMTVIAADISALGNPAAVASMTLGSARLMSGTGATVPVFTATIATAPTPLGTVSNATAVAMVIQSAGAFIGPSTVGTSAAYSAWFGLAHNGGTLVAEAAVTISYVMGK